MTTEKSSSRWWVIGLSMAAVLLVVYLLRAENPWDVAREVTQREAAGKKAKTEHFVLAGLWWAAAADLLAVLGLVLTARKWSAGLPGPDRAEVKRKAAAGVWLALLVVTAAGGFLRLPLARKSLWWDELWSAKYAVVGYYLGEPEQPLEDRYFGAPSWQRTLWLYTKPTNHAVASAPARISHLVWQKIRKPDAPNQFSDLAFRMPTLLCSLAAIFLVGTLGVRWGWPRAGLLAALLLALHPWHIRYGVDARAYSCVVLWTVCGCLWLTKLAGPGGNRWRWWAAFGFNQFLIVWSFPQAAFLALGFFLAAAVLIFRGWESPEARRVAVWRLLAVNFAAGMLFLTLFAPNLLQLREWIGMDLDRQGHAISPPLFFDFLGQAFFGLPWQPYSGAEAAGLPGFLGHPAWLRWSALLLMAGGAAFGLFSMLRNRRTPGIILAAVVLAGLISLLFFWISKGFFYHRFLVFLLAPLVWLPVHGWLSAPGGPAVRGLVTAAGLAAFLLVTGPQIDVLTSRPYSPLRQVARFFEEEQERIPSKKVIPVCYGHGAETLPVYRPDLRIALSRADLEGLMAEAKSEGARLLVAYGHTAFNRNEVPDGFELLDDPGKFVLRTSFAGIEPDFYFRVLEYRG